MSSLAADGKFTAIPVGGAFQPFATGRSEFHGQCCGVIGVRLMGQHLTDQRSTGIVKSYDAGSQRYQVAVESVGGEVVPMSLREEYMEVIGNEPPQAPSVPLQPPPPLSGGNSSQGLQKSAADALRRFGLGGPQQNQPQIPPFYQRDMNLEPEINRNEAARQMQARQQQQMVAQQAQQAQQAAQQAQQAAQQGGMPNMGKGMGMMRHRKGTLPDMQATAMSLFSSSKLSDAICMKLKRFVG
eukprot:symbB.v1.2.017244.t1/scaffold1344.1/size124249/7